jgi:hypothetical protein
MPLTAKQLTIELCAVLDPSNATAAVESYQEMQQRFFAGDWQPTELDGGRLCEAVARCLYQIDSGTVTHSQLPGEICEKVEDLKNQHPHKLSSAERTHICKAISLVYKFRSARGSVHISPIYKADYMDSMLMVHAGKWIFAEFLRLAWKKDKGVIAETIANIVQLEYSLIHELDGTPLVLETVSAPNEVLLLLNHAENHRLSKDELTRQAKNNKASNVATAVSRLLKENEIRTTGTAGEIALTPKGQKRVIEKLIPSMKK